MPFLASVFLKSTSATQLAAVSAFLKKGAAYAEQHKIEESVMLGLRLYPDMFPLSRQVQIACDQVTRAAARLSGAELPSFADVETTFAQLQERVTKANAYVQAADSDAIDKRIDTKITVPVGGGVEMTVTCGEFLTAFTVPNFYFHCATAYDILRNNGVVLGKRDFLRGG